MASVGVLITAVVIATPAVDAAARKPSVSKVSPNSGALKGGTRVTIRGAHLEHAKSVLFGSRKGTNLRVVSAGKLLVTAPKHKSGTINIRVVTSAGKSASRKADHFAYMSAPSVSKVSSRYGSTHGGTRVTVTGSRFHNVRAVLFGKSKGTHVKVLSSHKLQVTSPKHSSGRVDVRVKTPSGQSAAKTADHYRYGPPPAISKLSLYTLSLTKPTAITVYGSRFSQVSSVTIGGVKGTGLHVVSANRLRVTARPHTAERVYVEVHARYGTSSHSSHSLVTYPVPPVRAAKVTPGSRAVMLSWVNPGDSGFSGVTIRRATGSIPPTSVTAGSAGFSTGKGESTYTDTSVAARTRYSYSIFANAPGGAHSAPVRLTTTTAAAGTVSPIAQTSVSNVTADALPTTQIDSSGTAWTQLVLKGKVYVGGTFSGATSPGGQQVTRNNALAYNLTTGALDTQFNPDLNGEVLAIAASPDGKTIYLGGDFLTVGGTTQSYLAAVDPTTGALIQSFQPVLTNAVRTIVATDSTVYAGGDFFSANGNAVSHLAAFNASDGSLTGWHPPAGGNANGATVEAMVMAPGKTKVIVGGNFQQVNGDNVYGVAAVDAVDGSTDTWKVSQTLRDYNSTAAGTMDADAGVDALTTDGTSVYGAGYDFNVHNARPHLYYEGAWSARGSDGTVNWVEDCHGDTYGLFVTHSIVYTVSHAHFCGDVGGFPDDINNPHRTMAFSAAATGTLKPYTSAPTKYSNFGGTPSPSIYEWFPTLINGVNQQDDGQAAWSITGNARYVVEAGGFPSVNGHAQHGLTRFALPGTTGNPQALGPVNTGSNFKPTVSRSGTTAHVSFARNYDFDNRDLTYTLTRNGVVVWTGTYASELWSTPSISVTVANAASGQRYQLSATDGKNKVTGSAVTSS